MLFHCSWRQTQTKNLSPVLSVRNKSHAEWKLSPKANGMPAVQRNEEEKKVPARTLTRPAGQNSAIIGQEMVAHILYSNVIQLEPPTPFWSPAFHFIGDTRVDFDGRGEVILPNFHHKNVLFCFFNLIL